MGGAGTDLTDALVVGCSWMAAACRLVQVGCWSRVTDDSAGQLLQIPDNWSVSVLLASQAVAVAVGCGRCCCSCFSGSQRPTAILVVCNRLVTRNREGTGHMAMAGGGCTSDTDADDSLSDAGCANVLCAAFGDHALRIVYVFHSVRFL